MTNIMHNINKLQDVFSTIGTESIQLPQIVAIGGQSAGKSSVIEGIVGRSFLPRGPGCVTRCPLILQLIYTPLVCSSSRSQNDGSSSSSDDSDESEDYAKFLHTGDKVFKDFDEVCKEIERQTDELAGTDKEICDTPITLKIYSPYVPTLTLVDLPGMIKVPSGDPPHREYQILELVLNYIENPNSIILAVTAANTDIATSEALKLANLVDPDGERTLTVLTKLDLMDAGTDAKDMLAGNVIPVKLGIIGVVNHSQQDIKDKKGIPESLKKEAAYLQKNYPSFASTNGTPFLGRKLNRLLFDNIRNVLPDLNKHLEHLITEKENSLNDFGEEVIDKGHVMIEIIDKFANIYSTSIEGKLSNTKIGDCTCGGDIFSICFEVYKYKMECIDSLKDMTDRQIWIASKSVLEPAIFLNEETIGRIVRKEIARFKKPSLECLDEVHDKMRDQIQHCFKNSIIMEMDRFPKLRSLFLNILTKYLSKCAAKSKEMIENIMDMELSYINTQHPDFLKTLHGLENTKLNPNDSSQSIQSNKTKISKDTIKERMEQHVLSPYEKSDVDKIKALITSYFNIVKIKLLDSIPKAVLNFLVFPGKDNVRTELMKQLYKEEKLDDLFQESQQITEKRKEAAEMLKALHRADEILVEVGEILWTTNF